MPGSKAGLKSAYHGFAKPGQQFRADRPVGAASGWSGCPCPSNLSGKRSPGGHLLPDQSHDAEETRPGTCLGPAGAREMALREILDVISQCRDDETPVFDAILR